MTDRNEQSVTRRATKGLLRIMLFIGLVFVLAIIGAMIVTHMGDRISSVTTFFDRFAGFFFLFRLGLYGLVWYYWPALTRRAGSKREWSEEKTDLVISERYKMIPWLLVLEALISGPIIMRQFA